MNMTTRLILVIFISVLGPLLFLTYYLRVELSNSILKEKEDKLFGLARQLDHYIEGTFEDILIAKGAINTDREEKIRALNEELRAITDFVAYGNPGVGVGYYNRELDAIITYGPSDTFQYTVGQSIFEGHQGYEVMASGEPMVQTGELVRGNIMNCMWPINRSDETIGYIWSNETVDMVDSQIHPILNRIYGIIILAFLAIYVSIILTTRRLPEKIRKIESGIQNLFTDPNHRLSEVGGELNTIVWTINELAENVNFMKCYNKYIIEGIINGLVVVSDSGNITRTNKALHRILPGLEEDILNQDYRDTFSESIREVIRKGLEEKQFVTDEEIEITEKILEVYTNSIIDETNKSLGLVLVLRDITLLKNYEKELKEKERVAALGEMALGVVHEVKNPLTSVKGFTQLLQRPGLQPEKRNSYLSIIDSDLNRVNRLLNEMLIYGGYHHLEPERADLYELIQEIAEKLRAEHADLRVKVEFSGKGPCNLIFDRFKMLQVFYNLTANAVDAMSDVEEKHLDIIVKENSDSIRIDFIDNGSGVRPEDLDKLFDPFFTTKEAGTGFGLPICYKIVEGHGGTIQVSSKVGEYTRVRILLPRGEMESSKVS